MKKALLLLLTIISLNAQNFPSIYLNQDIQSVEKALDLELSKVSYWKDELKSRDTKFGYFQNLKSLLLCDKDKSTLSLYKRDETGEYKLRKEYGAYTGQKCGDKVCEGDLKTPVGIYRLEKRLDKLDSFYGPLAFVTSYPNVYDKIRNKTGSGIWIHGLPLDQERDDYTKGCIAIGNKNIECMDRNLDTKSSLLLIDQKLNLNPSKDALANILASLFEWRYAWLYNDLEKYLSFYDKTFVRFDGKDINIFSEYKRRVFSYNDEKRIKLKNISIAPYPGERKGLYGIYFDEMYESKRLTFEGKKTLVVFLDKNNKMKIITEQ